MEKPKFVRRTFPTLQQMHEDWEVNCMPTGAPHIQHVEMKKAFMAGVASMFHAMKYDVPEVDDDRGVAYLERIDDALVEYFTKGIYSDSQT